MIKNIEASIRARLLNISKENKINFDFILLRYMQERLLYRLANSEYRDRFVLKGGLFFIFFNNLNPRVTKDIDFLGISIKNSEEEMITVFSKVIEVEYEDGLKYGKDNIICERIKEDADYEGIRLNIKCSLGNVDKTIQIDVGFGDIVYPNFSYMNYPSFLNEEIKNLKVYSIESVIAEKFEAMVKLSYINSRMKDFFDIYNILSSQIIIGENLKKAIELTFNNRKTELDTNPVIFKEDFFNDRDKNIQWKIFLDKIGFKYIDFKSIITDIKLFLLPIVDSIKSNMLFFKEWDYETKIWNSVRR